MRTRKGKRLPIPQIEFSYASEAFNLELVAAPDAERIAKEKAEARAAQEQAECRQMTIASELTTARGGTFRTYTK